MLTTTNRTPSGIELERWGAGTPVVLVHGSLATSADEWSAQRPLADEGFELRVFDRRGYGVNAATATGEDFLADADDIIDLMAGGAHLIGHSYGGLGAMLAAARRPDLTLSLTLLEAPVGEVARRDAAWCAFEREVAEIWTSSEPDDQWVRRFLTAVGSDPSVLPPELLEAAVPLVPVFRQGRPFFEARLPLDVLAAAPFPTLVVSGGHHPGFEAMSRNLARRLGASLATVEGAGHEIQLTGEALHAVLRGLWLSSPTGAGDDDHRAGRA
jgi:pimeloyl-ACP methyl ester carboxylesterase